MLGPVALPAAENLVGLSRFRISVSKPIAADTGVEFYTSSDGGQSWQQVPDDRVQRPEAGKPSFIFTAPHDGSFGFWTRLLPVSGQSEAAPRPGSTPEVTYVIDTTPPTIELFSAAIERDAAGELQLNATWELRDPHLSETPVQFQVALSGGDAWTDLGEAQAAAGSLRQAVPQANLRLRLRATDRAGNHSLSPATIPALIAVAPVAAPASAPSPAPVESTAAVNAAPPAELPSLDDLGAQVDQQLAGRPAAPAAAAPAGTVAPAVDPLAELNALPPERIFSWPAPGLEGDDASLRASAEGLLAARAGRLLLAEDAPIVLAAARAAVLADELDRATAFYARLHDSSIANQALPEEVMLLLRRQLPIRARELARRAPPETRSPRLLLAEAYAWFSDDPQRSASLLRALPPEADCHLEAQVLRARCLLSGDKPDRKNALVILRNAARHQGPIAAHAQTLIELLTRD
jgi:hypothetical protein